MLELFTERRSEWTVTEVARESGMPFATTHRIIRALESHALLERSENRGYRLGRGAIDLGRRARASLDLRTLLAPSLLRLWQRTDETTIVCVVDARHLGARCIDRVEGGHPFRLSPDVAAVSPLYAGASGKALLASLGEDIINHVLATPLQPCAANTPTAPHLLRGDLDRVREQGWAFDDQELIDGAWGLAAPIFDTDDHVVASIGIIAPSFRLSDELKQRGIEYVVEAASSATSTLAQRGSHA